MKDNGRSICDNLQRAPILYLGYIGIMEKKMETIIFYTGYIGAIWEVYGDNGKENGN